jgi:hypothetical protein
VTPTLSSLTDTELRRTFDSGSFSRGKAYAHAGRVTVGSLDADERGATATVRGSGPQGYSTTVELRETRAGGTHILSTCTCHVGDARVPAEGDAVHGPAAGQLAPPPHRHAAGAGLAHDPVTPRRRDDDAWSDRVGPAVQPDPVVLPR